MAKKEKPPEAPGDIPAWFMTYSDVITLLMTFFILLLTFSTTEPERFEKVSVNGFSTGGATGVAGKKIDGLTRDSWVNRIRPPAARIAMRGAEMPPIQRAPDHSQVGVGLDALDEDENRHNEATTHYFDVEYARLFDAQGELTGQGRTICQMVAGQLRDLPFNASIQYRRKDQTPGVIQLMNFLFHSEQVRPGQVAISRVRKEDLPPHKIRFQIIKFTRPK